LSWRINSFYFEYRNPIRLLLYQSDPIRNVYFCSEIRTNPIGSDSDRICTPLETSASAIHNSAGNGLVREKQIVKNSVLPSAAKMPIVASLTALSNAKQVQIWVQTERSSMLIQLTYILHKYGWFKMFSTEFSKLLSIDMILIIKL
jgi:hypothetical protein